jgi:hypothetical protein
VDTYLAEHKAVPERVRVLARHSEVLELGIDRSLEQRALEARHAPRDHGGLVDPVQDTRHTREEGRLQRLAVLEQPQRVPSERPEGATDGNYRQLTQTLGCGSTGFSKRVAGARLTA